MGKIGRVRTLVSLGSLLWLAACTSPPHVSGASHAPVRVGEEFTLAAGDSARIADSGLVVIFDAVIEDSRCQKNMACVWEGNARAKLRLVQDDARRERTRDSIIEMNTSGRFVQRHAVGSVGTLVMRALDPQPPVEDATKYVATLFIEGRR